MRALKPRLRPHVQITRQFYRGRRWHVVQDPSSNQFYRLSPVAHEYVGLLDGTRTVEEVWNIALETHGDLAPTQHEVIELLGQLYQSNLLSIDVTPDTEQLLSRGRERLKKKAIQQAIGLMYFKLKLFNPDRYLAWLEPILRPALNRWGLLVWAAALLYTGLLLLPRIDDLSAAFKASISPANWPWMLAVFVLLKAIHETGHGVLVKRFGGQVPELGVMLLVLLPSPYVDASAAWAFSSKWRRIAVGAGGMIFELAVAAIAAHVWLGAGPGLVSQLAFNAMFSASLSTVLFNANPLMRFDGYYILSDLLEVPNLMQRSNKMLLHLCQRYLYRIEQSRAPSSSPSERRLLVVFGVLSTAYRVFLFFTITLYVMGQMFAVGLFLAIWTAAAWFILPTGKFVHWLATHASLSDQRGRAVATTLGLAAVAAITLGVVPLPDHRHAAGVVESTARTGVYFKTEGFIETAHVRVGDHVKAGQPIVTLTSHDLASRLAEARASMAEYEASLRRFVATDPAAAQVARKQIDTQRQLVAAIQERLDGLVVRAPHDGVIVQGAQGIDPMAVQGFYVKRGQLLCEVVDTAHTRVTATVETAQAAPLVELPREQVRVELRPVSSPGTLLVARDMTILPAGQRELPHAALGYLGGGQIEIAPDDRTGTATKIAFFRVRAQDVVLEDDGSTPWLGTPGQRVELRFSLPSKPLLSQWLRRMQQLLQGRVDI